MNAFRPLSVKGWLNSARRVAGGMVPMFRAGIVAALKGSTTIEEVVRSIQADA